MGIFDIFSDQPAKDAAAAQTAGLNAGFNQASGSINQGISSLSGNYGSALQALQQQFGAGSGALSSNYGNAGSALSSNYGAGLNSLQQNYGAANSTLGQAYGDASGALGQGFGAASGALGQGYGAGINSLQQNYGQALQPFLQNYGQANAGVSQLGNVLGLNGQGGNDAAMKALQSTPGYQFQLQQGDNAINAAAAANGTMNSGNQQLALANYNQGLAGTTYNNYVSQLQPFLGASQNAAGGIANTLTGLGNQTANAFTGLGAGQANLATGLGTGQATLATGLGAGQASNLTGLGNQTNNTFGSLGTGLANVDTGLGTGLNSNATNLGTNLANTYTGLGNQTATEQNQLAQLGYSTQTGIGNANANADLAAYNASGNFWNMLGGLGGMKTSGGGTLGGNALTGAGSAISSGANSLGGSVFDAFGPAAGFLSFSDERLKQDIEPVGELADGQPVYKYRYIGDNVFRIGLMAQDVEQTNPGAVVEIGGYKAVDYGKATEYAADLSRFLEAA